MANIVITKGSLKMVGNDYHSYRWDYTTNSPGEYLGVVRSDNFGAACDKLAEQHGGTPDQYFAAKRKVKE